MLADGSVMENFTRFVRTVGLAGIIKLRAGGRKSLC